jgi:hypothetical protein
MKTHDEFIAEWMERYYWAFNQQAFVERSTDRVLARVEMDLNAGYPIYRVVTECGDLDNRGPFTLKTSAVNAVETYYRMWGEDAYYRVCRIEKEKLAARRYRELKLQEPTYDTLQEGKLPQKKRWWNLSWT